MHAKAPRDELIGRDDELQQLRAALDEAFVGRGSLYVLEGEAGIGKTRLAAVLERIAAGRGARTAWGTCQEEAAEARGDDQRIQAVRNSGGSLVSVDRMEVVNALWAQ